MDLVRSSGLDTYVLQQGEETLKESIAGEGLRPTEQGVVMAGPSEALSLEVQENIGWESRRMEACSDILFGSGPGGPQKSHKEPSLNVVAVVEKFRVPLDP